MEANRGSGASPKLGSPKFGLPMDSVFRFGDFEYDATRRELRRHGIRLHLRRQSLTILLALIESPGALVTREELRARIWGSETFVDFEQALNSAIKRLRDALHDSADQPRYIDTVPGEGYRFIAPVRRTVVAEPTVNGAEAGKGIQGLRGDAPAARAIPQSAWFRRLAYGAICAVVLIAVAVIGIRIVRAHSRVQLRPDDWVLLTRFDNRTGEHDLDGVLDFALRSDLSDSRYVHIAAPERVQDTLRLMRKPADIPIDERVGREICMRDGGIRALVAERVEKLDGSYLLGISIIDPQTAGVLRSFNARANRHDEILPALSRLTDRVREDLGEAVADIARSDQQLEKATTPSLAALQLFTAAAGMPNEHAAQLLKQAVERDPEFASAHLYLGMATMELPGQRAASLESFRRAMELADKASERERLFIFQTFYGLQLGPGDLQKAIHYGEVLTSLYPDFDAGLKNQADLLLQAARPDEAATLYDRLLDVRPNAFSLAYDAWQSFAGNQPAFFKVRRPDLAQHFRAKAKEIAVRSHDLAAFWQPLIEASERWEAGDSAGAAVVLDEAHPADEWQEHTLALAYLSLGKLNKAESVAASAAAPENIRMLAAFLRNGVPGLRLYADHHSPPPAHVAGIPTILYARVGGFRSAGDAALPFEQQHAREMAIAGLNAMNARQYSKAVVELRAAVESTFSIAQQMFLANSLASALEHEGQTAEAVAVLEKLEPYGDDEITAGLLRPLILGHLARLYRLTGNRARADALDAIVKMSLAVADPDYSLDRQLADSRLAYKAPRQ